MVLFTIFIVSKAGGLIFNKNLSDVPPLSSNEYMRMGSTFHSLSAIASQLAPTKAGGIRSLEAETVTLQCLLTRTGTKIFVTARPGTRDLDAFLRRVYVAYADYVLKNPFYTLDQPIRVEKFDRAIEDIVTVFSA